MADIANIITEYDKKIKKHESRKRQRAKEKEDLFVADYIRHKYQEIYHEAQRVYHRLVKIHPKKPDIRKAVEHRSWKAMKTTTVHPVFIVEPATTSGPSTTEPTTTTVPEPTNTESTSTTTPEPSGTESTTTTTTPEPSTAYSDNLCLFIPLMKAPIMHPAPISETEETLQEEGGEQQQQLIDPEIIEQQNDPEIIEQQIPPEILEQEIPLEMGQQIDPEIIEQIITEIRDDPYLKDFFDDYEFQQELGLDIDIDINMDTGLEDELTNWGIW